MCSIHYEYYEFLQRVLKEKSLMQKLAKTAKANTERRAKILWADAIKKEDKTFIY